MRLSYILIIFISVLTLFSCEKDKENIEVEAYINLLKANQYDERELPAFNPEDIPALLEYRKDTLTITNFPHNPISSFWQKPP